MLLYIIRHGEPDYENDCLTENGTKQAAALAERLCTHGFHEIYSSPLGRAVQTAQPTCERLGLPYKIEDWMSESTAWSELSVSDKAGARQWAFSCQNTRLIEKPYTVEDWHTNPAFAECESAEGGFRRITTASDEFMARLGYVRERGIYRITAPSEKRIAAFCHHGFGTTWLSHLLSIPPHIFWAGFDIAHSSVTILEFKNTPDGYTAPTCVCLSDVSHIYKAQLPLKAAIHFFS
ncbi:MAG: histidine phosphatase family protein [Oscillospiraceae bacterium]|nr:histidine phosphatase family protein [Oscillospiraceae bacterium]